MKFEPLDPASFKIYNLANWSENTSFWLEQRLRHVSQISPLAEEVIRSVYVTASRPMVVADIGCGNAWLLDTLECTGIEFQYHGLDFNVDLIKRLRSLKGSKHATFEACDIEEEAPASLLGKADLVVNCFNFFEIPLLEKAFNNAVAMLGPGGRLLVFHIDPLAQIIAISSSLDEIQMRLRAFEESGEAISYEKRIEVSGLETERTYKGILYKISTYFALARHGGLEFVDFKEIVRAKDGPPQLYQMAVWSR